MNVRPETFDEIVGQQKAKTVLKTLSTSSRKTGEVCPHVLMSGPSGSGKTTLALAFAKNLEAYLHNVNASSIGGTKDLVNIFKKVRHSDVVFIDEIHALTKKAAESIYTILEDFTYFSNGMERPVNRFTCLGASTEIGSLPLPLKNRFQFTAEFETYSEQELTDICLLVCQKKGFKLKKEIANIIAKSCKGVPREVKNRTEWIYSYMIANDLRSISKEKLLEIINLQGVDENGLNDNDRHYLDVIKFDKVGIKQIARKLNVDDKTVQNLIEPYLIEQGYVTVGSGGREITPEGLSALGE